MKRIYKYIMYSMIMLLLSVLMINNIKPVVNAASLWQIEGTTIIAYNGTESVVTVPEGMTKIGEGAFSSNTKINKVILPDSMKELGMRAFAGCTGLSEINIENVAKFGEVCFEGTAIQEVVFSDEVKEIPVGLFAYASIQTVVLGKNVTTIASSAFYNCKSLKEIQLSDCLFSIGSKAFYNTTALTSIMLPDGLLEIGSQAFYNSGLTSVSIPGTIETVEAGTFSNCLDLSSIVFNDGIKKIGGSVFLESAVKKVHVPASVETIETFAFANAFGLTEITVDENNTHYDSDNGILYTEGFEKIMMIPYKHPDEVISLHDGVKTCEERFAAELVNVKKIIIPEGFVELNHNAFTNSKNIEEVVLPESLEIILSGAFSYCSALRKIELPSNLKELSNSSWWIGVFANCTSLKEVIIPDSVEKIGPYTFNGCTSLERVTYPAGLIDFGYKQFSGCAKLEEIIVKEGNPYAFTEDGIYYEIIDGVTTLSVYPAKKAGTFYEVLSSVEVIGNNAFDSAANLQEVIIPSTVTSMGTNVFFASTSIKKVTIDAPITVLPAQTFAESTIEEVILPSTLKEIDNGCFRKTSKLKKLELPEGLLKLGNILFYDSSIEEVILPDTVTEINQAFFYAKNLKKVKLSNSLTAFVASSFNNCAIEEITIPSSMVEIAEYSFVDCLNLRTVNVPDSVATIHATSFTNCTNLVELNVSPTNTYFVEEDGILYDKDKTKIVFVNQTRLSEVIVLPDTLEEIGASVFKDNKIIKELTIPSSVKNINYQALKGCQFEKVIIGEGTKALPDFMFTDCTKLKEVVLPESLEKMGCAVFDGCTSLESFIVPDNVNIESGFSLFRDCVNLRYVKLPSNLTIIPQYIFAGCASLESLEIPYGVVELETNMIQGCNNIKSIVVPETVSSIEYDAFVSSGVEKIVLLGNAPVLISSVWGDQFFPSDVEIYVFKSATGYTNKSYKKYTKQFKYIDNNVFTDDSSLDAVNVGEHQIMLKANTIYADLYRYYVMKDNEYQLLAETKESSYVYDAPIGDETYQFKAEYVIQKGKNEFTSSSENSVYVSKTYDEYMLEYLILEMISISVKQNPTFDELDYIMKQYDELSESYKEKVKENVDVDALQVKYLKHLEYINDIAKITDISLSIEAGSEITAGESTKLVVTFPEGVINKDVVIDVDKVGIIDLKADGSIYAIKEGKVKITVTALSGVSESIELTVNAVVVEEPVEENCSGCNCSSVIKNIVMFATVISLAYIIMKRGVRNA